MEFTQNELGQRDIINRIITLTKRVSDTILNQLVKLWSSHRTTEVNVAS